MKPQLLIPVAVFLVVSLACSIPLSAARIPTPAPTAFVLPPTITVCPFVENPGPPPPELVKRAQDAFAAFGFKGDLKVTGEGEYTCAEFHLRSVSFEFTLDVADLKDAAMMKALADKLKVYPVKQVLGNTNFGDSKVRFRAGKEFCWWDDVQGCGPAMPLP
jgi:hypothetical protein